jgi:hypothetical protein
MTRLRLWKVCSGPTKWALCLGLLPVTALACVDARADYEEYLRRPYVPREAGAGADVGESPCQEVLAANVTGKFFGSCLVKAVGVPFSLAVEQTVRAAPDGMTGEIDVSFTPLTTTATSLSDTAGSTTMLKTVPVDGECRYREDVGTLILPAAANSLGRDLESTDVVLRGKLLSAERSCSELDGMVPLVGLSLNGDGDVCVYLRASADGSLPAVPMEEYSCDPSILLPR